MRRLTFDDLYELRVPSDPQISPDGTQVAYVVTTAVREDDRYDTVIWVTGDGRPRQLTRGPSDSAPRWAPDGRHLAFLSRRDGDKPQLHVLPLDGGEARPVTSLPLGAGPAVWSPDGRRIAFAAPVDLDAEKDDAADPGAPVVVSRLGFKADGSGLLRSVRPQLFVLDVDEDGAQPRALTSGDWALSGPTWLPDGELLAFAGSNDPDRDLHPAASIFVVAVGGGEPTALTDAVGPAAAPLFTPDGASVVYAGAASLGAGHTRLLRVAADGGKPEEVVPAFDRNVMLGAPGYPGAPPRLADDARTVVFCARDRGCTHVYSTTLDGDPDRQPTKVIGGEHRTVGGMTLAPGSGRLAFVVATPASTGEVLVCDVDGSGEVALTELFASRLGDVELFAPHERAFTAPDGVEIHGWVIGADDGRRRAPLLLDVHGGPHNAWAPAFDGAHLYHQTLAADGWVVLIVNPRGSDGYGESFYRAVVEGWGTSDEADFLSAVDTLVEEGIVDPDRVAVTGYSYGGYMTCWLTARAARFRAAVAGGCLVDLCAELGSADLGWYLAAHEFGSTSWDDPERYARHSPMTHVAGVEAPTLLLHGEDDVRCPVGQAETWFTALRSRRVTTELVRYPGASHLFIVLGKPSHRIDYARRVDAWMRTHCSA